MKSQKKKELTQAQAIAAYRRAMSETQKSSDAVRRARAALNRIEQKHIAVTSLLDAAHTTMMKKIRGDLKHGGMFE